MLIWRRYLEGEVNTQTERRKAVNEKGLGSFFFFLIFQVGLVSGGEISFLRREN